MTRAARPAPPGTERLFAYGTLLLPAIMHAVIGRRASGRAATLAGYARFLMGGETFPAIVPDARRETRGLLFDDITRGELTRLDAYEGDLYAQVRVEVGLDAGERADALTYVLLPEHRDQLTAKLWDRERFAAEQAAAFLKSLRAEGES